MKDRRGMKKIYKKLISGMLLAVLMVGGLTRVNAYAASETRDWYVYNNDDYTKNPVSLCKFGNYYKKNYVAKCTYRSSNAVSTKITGGTSAGTKLGASYYTVTNVPVNVYVETCNKNVYIYANLNAATTPAATRGIISHT